MPSSCISLTCLYGDEAVVEICESLSPDGDYIIKQRDRHERLLFLEAIKNKRKPIRLIKANYSSLKKFL